MELEPAVTKLERQSYSFLLHDTGIEQLAHSQLVFLDFRPDCFVSFD